jgi:hypothetical protein
MKRNKLFESILESAELHDILDKVTALTLSNSADLCVDTILDTRKRIAQEGPKEFWLENIEDCMTSYRHLAYCYNYYTGEHLPTIEERLNK